MGQLATKEYEKHLFSENTDGYIQLIKFEDKKIIKMIKKVLKKTYHIIKLMTK